LVPQSLPWTPDRENAFDSHRDRNCSETGGCTQSRELIHLAGREANSSWFLDFESYAEWHHGFFIEASKAPVEVGDVLNVNAGGMKFKPTVQENSSSVFRWIGSLPFIFTGKIFLALL
jgi:hypothetical protein